MISRSMVHVVGPFCCVHPPFDPSSPSSSQRSAQLSSAQPTTHTPYIEQRPSSTTQPHTTTYNTHTYIQPHRERAHTHGAESEKGGHSREPCTRTHYERRYRSRGLVQQQQQHQHQQLQQQTGKQALTTRGPANGAAAQHTSQRCTAVLNSATQTAARSNRDRSVPQQPCRAPPVTARRGRRHDRCTAELSTRHTVQGRPPLLCCSRFRPSLSLSLASFPSLPFPSLPFPSLPFPSPSVVRCLTRSSSCS